MARATGCLLGCSAAAVSVSKSSSPTWPNDHVAELIDEAIYHAEHVRLGVRLCRKEPSARGEASHGREPPQLEQSSLVVLPLGGRRWARRRMRPSSTRERHDGRSGLAGVRTYPLRSTGRTGRHRRVSLAQCSAHHSALGRERAVPAPVATLFGWRTSHVPP